MLDVPKKENDLKRHPLSLLYMQSFLVKLLHADFYACVDLRELQFGKEISDIPPLLAEHV